jgi:hypothetical protein
MMTCTRGVRLALTVVTVVVGRPEQAVGSIINVPADYATVQAAVDATIDGDTVVVAPGTYTGVGNRDIDFGGRNITVRSSDPDDPVVVAATIIDCAQLGRGFIFQSGETTDSVIDGLTVVNGFATDGAGVYLLNGSGATLRNSVFSDHIAPVSRGIVQVDNFPTDERDLAVVNCEIVDNLGAGLQVRFIRDLTVIDSTLSTNTGPGLNMTLYGSDTLAVRGSTIAGNGGSGLIVKGSEIEVFGCTIADNGETGVILEGNFGGVSAEMSNCSITGNTSASGAGGIRCHSDIPLTIRSCMVTGNTGRTSGGLQIMGFGAFEISTSTFAGNEATEFGGGGIRAFGTDPTTIRNCVLWGNAAPEGQQLLLASGFNNPAIVSVDYSDLEGGVAAVSIDIACCSPSQLTFGPGNIDTDPDFIDPGAGDYHLSPASAAINAGDPGFIPQPHETDIDGDQRVVAGRVDLGADEFQRPADIDGDGVVGINDFLAVLAAWGPCGNACGPEDIDGDGVVGITDVLLLLADWG